VRDPVPIRLLRFASALLIVLAITLFYRRLMHVNVTTVALSFLLAILVTSTVWGMAVSVFMSVAAMLAFNYYFLPPIGTFTIADPQNWVALFAFLVTSVVASRLSTEARKKAEDAHRRQREIERLYAFSQGLLGFGNVIELLNSIPRQVVDAFEVGAAALFLADKQKVYRSGRDLPQLDADRLKAVNAREEPVIEAASGLCFVPVRLGVRSIGSLGISGPVLSRPTLEALGSLVAIAVERARAIEQVGKNEAARQGERLKSALLDAITHDFRTPLTSIKASVTSLLFAGNLGDAQRHELLTIIDEESNRLNHLVGEAAEIAQLEAGEIELQLQPHEVNEVVAGAISHCKALLGDRPLRVNVAKDLPAVRVDLHRGQEALERLLENAHMYSPAREPICVTAELNGDFVTISVADRGPGIDDQEQALIFDKFYRGKDQRYLIQGTGMGLPIAKAIVEALGGSVALVSQRGHGSVFSLNFPVAGSREGR
jgi:two-component system, OmpR family, sensor histidine kinase KdpD